MEMDKSDIANKIIELRNAAGWSRSDLSRESGVTMYGIGKAEEGKQTPSLMVIRHLVDAFNVSIETLGAELMPAQALFTCGRNDAKTN